jgi:thiamine biosynthesis lipoprotein
MEDKLNPYYFEEPLFGGKAGFMFYDIEPEAAELIRPALLDEAKRLQKIFNFYDGESELSTLNRKRTLNVSPELLEVLESALVYAAKTSGAYDVSQGKLILTRKKGEPTPESMCSYKDILIQKDNTPTKNTTTKTTTKITSKNTSNNKVTLTNDDVLIDLGSIAKGYIADKLAEFLQESGVNSCLIDARGDVLIFGDTEETIHIQHPRNEKEIICDLKLKNGAVATSGDYKQYNENYARSHILNQKELISVTVVADTLMMADVLTSAVFVTDGELRREIIDAAVNDGCKILTVDDSLNVKKYNWL